MEKLNLIDRKERIWFWDTIKFLMMLLVVEGHCLERMMYFGRTDLMPMNLFIYSFHMPMFIFIFGIFYKEKNSLRKFISFLVSGYVLKAFSYFSALLINGKATFTLFYDPGLTWFLFSLAWFILLAWLLRKIDKRIVLAVAFAVSLFTGYFKEINDFLCLSRTLVFFPYFWLGTMIDKDVLLTKLRKYRKYLWVPAMAVLLGWFAVCVFRFNDVKIFAHLFSGKNPFSEATHGMGCLYRLATSGITLLVCAAILVVVPEKKIPIVSYLGRNTLNVYFWQYTFIYIIFRFVDMKQLIKTKEGILLVLIIGLALTFFLSLDIFNFPLKYVNKFIMNFKPKKSDRSQ